MTSQTVIPTKYLMHVLEVEPCPSYLNSMLRLTEKLHKVM